MSRLGVLGSTGEDGSERAPTTGGPVASAALPLRWSAFSRGAHALGGVLGRCPRPCAWSRRSGWPRRSTGAACAPRPPWSRAPRAAPPAPAGRRGACASSIRSSWGTTQPASPISLARAASMRSPVSSSSIAYCQLSRCGRRIAPTIVGTPSAHLGEAELGALARDHEVAPRHEREPVAEAVAVHRRDHRLEDLPPALERVDGRLLPERARELADRAGAVLHVAARAERASRRR